MEQTFFSIWDTIHQYMSMYPARNMHVYTDERCISHTEKAVISLQPHPNKQVYVLQHVFEYCYWRIKNFRDYFLNKYIVYPSKRVHIFQVVPSGMFIIPMVLAQLTQWHLRHASFQLQISSGVANKHAKNSISLFYSCASFLLNIAFPGLITEVFCKCL